MTSRRALKSGWWLWKTRPICTCNAIAPRGEECSHAVKLVGSKERVLVPATLLRGRSGPLPEATCPAPIAVIAAINKYSSVFKSGLSELASYFPQSRLLNSWFRDEPVSITNCTNQPISATDSIRECRPGITSNCASSELLQWPFRLHFNHDAHPRRQRWRHKRRYVSSSRFPLAYASPQKSL